MELSKLKQLRVFEKMVLSCVLNEFGKYLTTDKRNELSSQSLIPDDYEKEFTSAENIQGEIFRLVLSHVFENILCVKEISLSDGSSPSIKYGELLQESLIVYFAEALSLKYNMAIDSVPNTEDKIIFIKKIRDSLENNFKPLVFSCNATAILSVINDEEITKQCDSDAVKRYLMNKNKEKETILEESKTPIVEEKIEEDAVKNTPSANTIEENEEDITDNFLDIKQDDLIDEEPIEETKLTDENGNIRLISTEEYTKICMKTVNGKEITPEEMKLLEYYDEHNFEDDEPIKKQKRKQIKPIKNNNQNQNIKTNQNIKVEQVNKPNSIKQNATLSQKLAPVFLVVIVMVLGVICGIALFKLKGI